MHVHKSIHLKHGAKGFSLIEVLVAIVVLSLGMLGLAALQMTSLRFNQSALMRTQATTLASDIFDCMRANRTLAANYVIGPDPAAGTSIAAQDLINWKARIKTLLGPAATGSIATDLEKKYTVTITWSDASDDSNYRSGRATQTFTYISQP